MKFRQLVLAALLILVSSPAGVVAQDFRKWEAQIAEYKQWLDRVGSAGARLWLRLDSSRRPHKLYLGEGFERADHQLKEEFVEIFSRYLSGHPEKFALIDLFDGATGAPIGEFGWGGFKLYPKSAP